MSTECAGGEESAEESAEEVVEEIVDDVRNDIVHGHVEDDVSHVLEERFEEVGLQVRPEEVDDLAEKIENDVSR